MPLKIVVCSCALVGALLLAALPASADPSAGSSRGCSVVKSPNRYGATYARSLRVSGVSCKDGKNFMKAYNKCRKRSGGSDGRCRRRVSRFSCRESRSNKIRTAYDGLVKCKRRGAVISFRYTQYT